MRFIVKADHNREYGNRFDLFFPKTIGFVTKERMIKLINENTLDKYAEPFDESLVINQGDYVVTLENPLFDISKYVPGVSGPGAGYTKPCEILKVDYLNYDIIAFFKDQNRDGCGIFISHLRKATPKEIRQYNNKGNE